MVSTVRASSPSPVPPAAPAPPRLLAAQGRLPMSELRLAWLCYDWRTAQSTPCTGCGGRMPSALPAAGIVGSYIHSQSADANGNSVSHAT